MWSKELVLVNTNHKHNPVKKREFIIFLPNLGIDSLYTNLRIRCPGFRIQVIDAVINNLGNNQTKESILECNPRFVGFYTTYLNLKSALDISGDLKRENAHIITIIGGPGARSLRTLSGGQNIEGLDYCVMGDGEKILEKIVSGNKEETKTKYLQDIIYDLDSLEFPRRECFNTEEYIEINKKSVLPMPGQRILHIYTSKGCEWAKCRFCTIEGKFRTRNAHNIRKELKYLIPKFRLTMLNVFDDNFICSSQIDRTYEMCEVLKDFPIKWYVSTRVTDVVKDVSVGKNLLRKMKESGCTEISWGAESGDGEILKMLGKGMEPNEIKKAVEIATEAGIKSKLFFMYNSPGETGQSLCNTLSFVRSLVTDYKPKFLLFFRYSNIPGTINWRLGLGEGKVPPSKIEDFRKRITEVCMKNNTEVQFVDFSEN